MKTRKLWLLGILWILLILIICISSCDLQNPEEDDEYFLYGSVKDESGNNISGAEVFIMYDMGITSISRGDSTWVELSSFTAVVTPLNEVLIKWVSESETNLMGYRVYRNTSADQNGSISINPILIPATNTSQQQVYALVDNEVESGALYYYWLEAVGHDASDFYGPVSIFVQGEEPPILPEVTTFRNSYPNPFCLSTNIETAIKGGESANLVISHPWYGTVKTFTLQEGFHLISWNGTNSQGDLVPNGLYQIKLTSPSFSGTKNVLFMKPDLSNLPNQVTTSTGYKIPLWDFFQFNEKFIQTDETGNEIGEIQMTGNFTIIVRKEGYQLLSQPVVLTDFNKSHKFDLTLIQNK